MVLRRCWTLISWVPQYSNKVINDRKFASRDLCVIKQPTTNNYDIAWVSKFSGYHFLRGDTAQGNMDQLMTVAQQAGRVTLIITSRYCVIQDPAREKEEDQNKEQQQKKKKENFRQKKMGFVLPGVHVHSCREQIGSREEEVFHCWLAAGEGPVGGVQIAPAGLYIHEYIHTS